jgi:hypothetical protein
LLFTCGLLGRIPAPRQRVGLVAYVLALALFDAICFWAFLVPYFACCRFA